LKCIQEGGQRTVEPVMVHAVRAKSELRAKED
jgi:hypothetical protein